MRTKVPTTVCVLIAVAVGLSACSSSGRSGSAAPKSTSSPTTELAGPPYRVQQFTLTFTDRSRPTPRNGTYPGAPSRSLPTVVSLPVGAPTPLPLVVFSTAIGGTGTNYGRPVPALGRSRVRGRRAAKTGQLAGKLDSTRIALAGKSLGALTTLRTASLVSNHESRENAVISLTGGGNAGSGADTMFTGVTVPLLLVHGDNDHTVPYPRASPRFRWPNRRSTS